MMRPKSIALSIAHFTQALDVRPFSRHASLLLHSNRSCAIVILDSNMSTKSDVHQGTLALMIMKTLEAMGPLHGYGIARRIEQISGNAVMLNQGTIYASLVRLQQRGWIGAEWGTSENNRRAKFYAITKRGRTQLEEETANWHKVADVMGQFLPKPRGTK